MLRLSWRADMLRTSMIGLKGWVNLVKRKIEMEMDMEEIEHEERG